MTTTLKNVPPSGSVKAATNKPTEKKTPQAKAATAKAGVKAAMKKTVRNKSGATAKKTPHTKAASKPAAKNFLSETAFADMHLSDPTKRALKEVFKYESASEIQSKTIPLAVQGRDVFGKAGTGQGKTLAFLVPTVEVCARAPATVAGPIGAIVLSPSRELAIQTHEEARRLCTFNRLKPVLVIGGVSSSVQLRELRGACDIIVATPGRLNDLLKVNKDLRDRVAKIKIVVLDEADRLLDPGFIRAVETIIELVPPPGQKQTLLFTATVGEAVKKVSQRLLKDPVFVDVVRADDPPARLKQTVMMVPPLRVAASLAQVLRERLAIPGEKIIVFLPGVQATKFVALVMARVLGAKVLQLHSDMQQNQRTRVVQELTAAKTAVVFATDVIARGLDIDDITFVIQVGWVDPETYTHRAGRTARAGREGDALLIASPEECKAIKAIVATRHPKLPIAGAQPPTDAPALPPIPSEDTKAAHMAFTGLLGAYKSHMRELGWQPRRLAGFLKALLRGFGMTKPPEMTDKLLGKLHLTRDDFKTPSKQPSAMQCAL